MAKAIDIPITATDKTGPGLGKAKSSINSFLSSLRQEAGRRSTIGQLGQLLAGGGAVAGISFIGRQVAEITHKASELVTEFRAGEKTTGELIQGLAEGIPIIGGWVQAGRELRGLLDGTAQEVERINAENKAMTAVLDGQRAIVAAGRKNAVDFLETIRDIGVEITKLQLKEPERTVFGLGAQTRKDLESQAKDAAKRQAEIQADYQKTLAETQAGFSKLDVQPSQKTFGTDETEASKLARQSAEIARKGLTQQLGIAARERDEALKSLEKQDAATRSAIISRGAFRESEARQSFDAQANAARKEQAEKAAKDLVDAYAEARQAHLRAVGNDLAADLDEANEKLVARLKEIKEDAGKASGLFSPSDTENQQRIARQAQESQALAEDKFKRDSDAAQLAEIERNKALLRPAIEGAFKSFLAPFGKIDEIAKKTPAELLEPLYRKVFPKTFGDKEAPPFFSGNTATTREARFLTGAGAADQVRADTLAEAKKHTALLSDIATAFRQNPNTAFTFN